MSGRGNAGDLDRAEALVRKHPGLPGILLAWAAMGGEIGPAGPTDLEAFERFVKALSIQKRLADLVKRGRIKKGVAKVGTRFTDQGYYPMGMRAVQRQDTAGKPLRPVLAETGIVRPVNRNNGKAGLAGLREALDP